MPVKDNMFEMNNIVNSLAASVSTKLKTSDALNVQQTVPMDVDVPIASSLVPAPVDVPIASSLVPAHVDVPIASSLVPAPVNVPLASLLVPVPVPAPVPAPVQPSITNSNGKRHNPYMESVAEIKRQKEEELQDDRDKAEAMKELEKVEIETTLCPYKGSRNLQCKNHLRIEDPDLYCRTHRQQVTRNLAELIKMQKFAAMLSKR